jgi:uncharacterized protein YcbX
MWVKEIWRYPVKSMAGEQLERARLTPSGIEGDRVVQVQNGAGRTVTARTHPGLLGFRRTDANGQPSRRSTMDRSAAADVRRIVGPGAPGQG